MSKSRAEKEREKVVLDRCQILLDAVLKDEDNKYCVDCDSKGPRWASWNIGILLCIRCAGIHRNLGVHISKVRSVNLDSWAPNQVSSMQCMGNSKARAVYEANLPDDYRRPTSDSGMEAFIRSKYEKKKFIAKEWVETKPPDLPVGWAELIEAEKLGKIKDPKFIASLPKISNNNHVKSEKKADAPKLVAAKPAAASIKSAAVAPPVVSAGNHDLLGLSVGAPVPVAHSRSEPDDDLFSNFVSATTVSAVPASAPSCDSSNQTKQSSIEDDFFNQKPTTEDVVTTEEVVTTDPSKMSNSSIMALFSSGSSSSAALPTNQVNSVTHGGGGKTSAVPGQFQAHVPGQFPAPVPGQFQSPAVPGLSFPGQPGHQQQFPGQPRPNLPGQPFPGQSFSGQQSFHPFPGQQFPGQGVTAPQQLYNGQQQPPFNGQQQPPQLFVQQQQYGQQQQQLYGQQLLNNNQVNMFADPVAASPKMINSLPQNVFQMNNQLAGLRLQGASPALQNGGSPSTFQNGPFPFQNGGTPSPFQNGGTPSPFQNGASPSLQSNGTGLAPSLWQ